MDTQQLIYFKQIVKDKTLTKAAENLYVSQQALSSSIVKLEEEFGVELFNRSNRGMELTEEGEYFKRQAELILSTVENTKRQFKHRDKLNNSLNLNKEKLKITIPLGIHAEMKDFFLNEHDDSYTLETIDLPDLVSEQYVEENRVHFGINMLPLNNPIFEKRYITKRLLYVLMHQAHPLANNQELRMKDLKNEIFIEMNPSFKSYHLLLDACHSNDFQPRHIYQVNKLNVLHNFVNLNQGIAISSKNISEKFIGDETILIPIDPKDIALDIYLIYRKDKVFNDFEQAFIDKIINYYN